MNLNARTPTVREAYCFEDLRAFLSLGYSQAEGGSQGTLTPVVLDDSVECVCWPEQSGDTIAAPQ